MYKEKENMNLFSSFISHLSSLLCRQYFTLLELLAVIAIIAILAGLLLPVLNQAREKGKTISCLSNVRMVNIGIMNYVDAYNDYLPAGHTGRSNGRYWHVTFARLKLVNTVVPSWNVNGGIPQGIYACPSMKYDILGKFEVKPVWNTYKGCSYGLNRYLNAAHTAADRAARVWRKIYYAKTPSRTYTTGDKWMSDRPGSNAPQVFIRARDYQPGERHCGRWNAAMIDGHAATVKDYPCRGKNTDFDAPEWRVY